MAQTLSLDSSVMFQSNSIATDTTSNIQNFYKEHKRPFRLTNNSQILILLNSYREF